MANSVSSTKRIRQNLARNERNRGQRSALRTQLKKLEAAMKAGDPAKAREELEAAEKRLDKAAKKRVIHPNAAARKKSRLARRLNALNAAGAKKS